MDMVQNFVVEVNSIPLLERYLEIAMRTVLESREEFAVKIIDYSLKNFTLCLPPVVSNLEKSFPVMLISGWYLPEGKENSYFSGYRPWKIFHDEVKVIQHVRDFFAQGGYDLKNLATQFMKRLGDGYSHCFNQNDGTVKVGCKLQSCFSFPQVLAISLVHIYYGK